MNTCANCGSVMGKLEKPRQFQGNPVCVACHQRLGSSKPGFKILMVICSVMAAIGVVLCIPAARSYEATGHFEPMMIFPPALLLVGFFGAVVARFGSSFHK